MAFGFGDVAVERLMERVSNLEMRVAQLENQNRLVLYDNDKIVLPQMGVYPVTAGQCTVPTVTLTLKEVVERLFKHLGVRLTFKYTHTEEVLIEKEKK